MARPRPALTGLPDNELISNQCLRSGVKFYAIVYQNNDDTPPTLDVPVWKAAGHRPHNISAAFVSSFENCHKRSRSVSAPGYFFTRSFPDHLDHTPDIRARRCDWTADRNTSRKKPPRCRFN